MTEKIQIDFDKINKSLDISDKDKEFKKKYLKKFIEKVFQIENRKIGNL